MKEVIRTVGCYTKEQQKAYESLNYKQRAYIDLRGAGVGKADAYQRAGYTSQKNSSTNACKLENTPIIKELISIQLRSKVAKEIFQDATSDVSKVERLDSLADGKIANELVVHDTGELAKQLAFYTNIAKGKIVTTRTTITYEKDGTTIKSKKVETIDDVEARMKARKKIDELLGLNDARNIGEVKAGPITINIVDCSRKKAPEMNIDIDKATEEGTIDADLLNQSLVDEKEK